MKTLRLLLAVSLTLLPLLDPVSAHADMLSGKPALSDADKQAVMSWIGGRVAASQQPFCYLQSNGRGAGKPLSTCPAGQDTDAGLCYPACNTGYSGAGPVCWQDCPTGYSDTGAFCHINQSLTAAVATSCSGSWPWEWKCTQTCPSGYTNAGIFCTLNAPANPSGWKGDGIDLTKDSDPRGAGKPMGCASGLQEDAGLCYNACKVGYHGVGPVCWQDCPAALTKCGAGCANSTISCVSTTSNMVLSTVMMVASISALVVTAGAAAPAVEAAEVGEHAAQDAGEAAVTAEKEVAAGQEAEKVAKEATTLEELTAKINKAWDSYKEAKAAEVQALSEGKLAVRATTYTGRVIQASKASLKLAIVGKLINQWAYNASASFPSLATPEVVATLDAQFRNHPQAEQWVKTQYAMQNLSFVTDAEIWQTATTAASIVGTFDPTGVLNTAAAFANPKCGNNDPFPKITILY